MYRRYFIKIQKDDVDKADTVLVNRMDNGDLDYYEFRRWDEGVTLCVIAPIIYEDLETILDEFKKAGIQIL